VREARSLLEELKAVQALMNEIKWLDELITGLESAVQHVTQGIRVGSRGTVSNDAMGEETVSAVDSIRRLLVARTEYADRTLEIERRLDEIGISQQHRDILRCVYMKGFATKRCIEDGDLFVPNWLQIADEMHYHVKYCQQLYRNAKEEIRNIQTR
jgi:hypothetical protein